MTKNIFKAEAQRIEAEPWKEVDSVHFHINVVVNGIGLSRDITENNDPSSYGGISEADALAIVKKLKSKGFDTQLWRVEYHSKRIA